MALTISPGRSGKTAPKVPIKIPQYHPFQNHYTHESIIFELFAILTETVTSKTNEKNPQDLGFLSFGSRKRRKISWI